MGNFQDIFFAKNTVEITHFEGTVPGTIQVFFATEGLRGRNYLHTKIDQQWHYLERFGPAYCGIHEGVQVPEQQVQRYDFPRKQGYLQNNAPSLVF